MDGDPAVHKLGPDRIASQIFPSASSLTAAQPHNASTNMLPEPALTFTIPSVHDGLPLDCRIYHPASLRASVHAPPPWKRQAVVLAHPYAPLGGSFDDPVIETVGASMLKEGYLLGTFNFRGAGHSAGKTSWTSKAERADFQSLIGFLAYYIHHLDHFKRADAVAQGNSDETPRHNNVANGEPIHKPVRRRHVLVVGGYSYGSLITAQLPPLETVLEPFASPSSASNEAQIRLRAASLAEQQNTLARLTRDALLEMSAKRSPSQRGVRVGGDEGSLSPGRARRSAEGSGGGRRSRSVSCELEEKLHELVSKTKSSVAARNLHHRHMPAETTATTTTTTLEKVPEENGDMAPTVKTRREPAAQGRLPQIAGFEVPQQAYVLLSPIPGLASHLVTLRLLPGALSRARRPEDDPAEAKLLRHPTLAVHGDADSFVLPYKAREWVARLADAQGSRFRGVGVPTAGHFWAEEGVLDKMLDLVGEFVRGLVVDDGDGDGVE
ncbi:hypothetical protein CRV24_002549 [Beauveria bassiana]|nr:hypothetical protein CRV24_002549 [Beauveria bassiana]KAH8717916.1 hypothetical protein HC256_002592 [Beauveria bassiana]